MKRIVVVVEEIELKVSVIVKVGVVNFSAIAVSSVFSVSSAHASCAKKNCDLVRVLLFPVTSSGSKCSQFCNRCASFVCVVIFIVTPCADLYSFVRTRADSCGLVQT